MPLSKLKIRWGYFIAFLLLLSSYFLVFYIIGLQVNASKEVNHSYTILNNLETIKSEITDAETGVRGYAITKNEQFLDPYYSGSKNVPPLYQDLVRLTKNNKTYRRKVDTLGSLINRRLQYFDYVVNDFRKSGVQVSPAMIANRENSKRLMDSIRLFVSQLKAEEQALMKERNSKLTGIIYGTEIITIVSLLITLCTIFYSVVIYNAGNKARLEADRQMNEYSRQLEGRVAELKKVNTELEELKSLEKFTSTGRIARTIAHEVRNPLTNISLAAEQLKDFATANPDALIMMDMIGRNVVRINQLVSDLLNSTRFAQLEFADADINEILDDTLLLAADRVELKKATVKKDYGNSLQHVSVDREKIQLAFLNIIVNALEAIENETGVLLIRTYRKMDKCIIEFTDNGKGMDQDTLQKLFDPYFSVKPKGNGLGLTNTQNIILNHKGNINVRSRPGEGTTFTIILSLRREEE